jgi:hypothetical protein
MAKDRDDGNGPDDRHGHRPPEIPTIDPRRVRGPALARLRQQWVLGNDELGPLVEATPAKEPLVIHDLDGTPLFYDFEMAGEEGAVGVVRAAASPAIGTPLVAAHLRPRGWDPADATKAAEKWVRGEHRGAKITGTELVCYSYPKIGVRVTFDAERRKGLQVIVDVADGLPVRNLGAEELEGSTAYSYYAEIVRPQLDRRLERWWRLEEDLDVVRQAAPEIVEGEEPITIAVRAKLYDRVVSRFPTILWPISSSRVIRFGPRCSPHECFELYAQQTNVFCAVATGQMILDFYRWYHSQDDIAVAMSTGAGGTTNPNQVTGYETLSNRCLDATFDGTATWAEAKAEIDANRPLKSGIPGHARAAAGWMRTWSWSSWGFDRSLKVYDPWPWNADICAGGDIEWEDWDAVTHTNWIYVRLRTTNHS